MSGITRSLLMPFERHGDVAKTELTKMVFCCLFWGVCAVLYMVLYSFGDHQKFFGFFQDLHNFITDASDVVLLFFQLVVLYLMSVAGRKIFLPAHLTSAVSEEAWKLTYTVAYAMVTQLLIEGRYFLYLMACLGITFTVLTLFLHFHDFQQRHPKSIV